MRRHRLAGAALVTLFLPLSACSSDGDSAGGGAGSGLPGGSGQGGAGSGSSGGSGQPGAGAAGASGGSAAGGAGPAGSAGATGGTGSTGGGTGGAAGGAGVGAAGAAGQGSAGISGGSGQAGAAGAVVPPAACAQGCAATAMCIADACRCLPGFTGDGATCTRDAPSTDVATRTQADVCAHWTAGHATLATTQYTPGTGGTCDPGVMRDEAMFDAARRWSMFRWLVGLPAVSVDRSRDADMQQCALMLKYAFKHDPPPETPCYTAGGADAASRSMICSAGSASNCMDLYTLESYATDSKLSHRKIVVAPGRDNVAFGVSVGGSCALYGYPTGPLPAPPPFVSVPNAGPTPMQMTGSTWSIHPTSDAKPLPIADTQVYDETASKPVVVSQNLKYAGINGFDLKEPVIAGHTYRVTLTDGTSTIEYRTTPVTCP